MSAGDRKAADVTVPPEAEGGCHPLCEGCPNVAPTAGEGPRAAVNCRVMEALGRWGWPCHRTLAQVTALEGDGRCETLTVKVPRAATGLAGSLFAHVERDADFRVVAVRFSYKWKDDCTLDGALSALGEAVMAVCRNLHAASGDGGDAA